MNYKSVYNQIILRAQTRILVGYKERHHIIPKCLGGDNSKTNLVDLTAREHYIVHWLLIRIYPNNSKLANAFWRMSTSKKFKLTSRMYQEAKNSQAKATSKLHKGKIVSQETGLKISNRKIGKKLSPLSETTKNKISVALMGKNKGKTFKQSQQTINKKRQALTGKKQSTNTCLKKSISMKGKNTASKTIEQRLNISKGKIHAFDLSGNFIGEYLNAVFASQELQISNNISAVVRGERKHCGGYTFKRI